MDTRRVVLVVLFAGAALALTGWLLGLVSNGLALLVFGREEHLTGIAAVLRTVLTCVAAYLVTRRLQQRVAREVDTEEEPVGPVLIGCVLGYGLDPFAWSGKALLGEAFLHAGVVTWVIDLVIWTAVAGVAVMRPETARF
ncbi:hypothetical protein ACIB24_01865 [Spongisporangium articulatum]|uniref:Uncharacterized protein n=1 Tax=Spongisporangium articulatum TaxID=3362603 RepID=A0ABW8AIK8_9ACTN